MALLMSELRYKNNELYLENVAIKTIAGHAGSPVYIYSKAKLTQQMSAYLQALDVYGEADHSHKICYAVKANANLSILNYLASLGAGFDVVSAGELECVLRAGGNPEKIVFSGVGKKAGELQYALDTGIYCFNIESEAEMIMLQEVASRCNKPADISVRVNPDVDAGTHPYISTGLLENKFGVDIDTADALYRLAATCSHLAVKGIDCHIGSQITEIQPFLNAMDKLLVLVNRLHAEGIMLSHIDMGGGLGISDSRSIEGYVAENTAATLLIDDYVKALVNKLKGTGLSLILEPGRSLVAESGTLLMQVILLKENNGKGFAVVDAAMNDYIRPALYQVEPHIMPVYQRHNIEPMAYDIVGPVCETSDCFIKKQLLSVTQGDYLAMMNTGAYGMSMASNYNSRPRVAEVLVDQERWKIIRRRETLDDLLASDMLHVPGK